MPASSWHAVDSSAGKAMYEIEITRLTFGCREVQDIAVLPEHVDFLNTRNGLDVQLLQRSLELLVILSTGRFRFPHDLAAHSPLSTYLTARNLSLRFLAQFLREIRGSSSPILLAAACACNLASFAGSIVLGVEDRG